MKRMRFPATTDEVKVQRRLVRAVEDEEYDEVKKILETENPDLFVTRVVGNASFRACETAKMAKLFLDHGATPRMYDIDGPDDLPLDWLLRNKHPTKPKHEVVAMMRLFVPFYTPDELSRVLNTMKHECVRWGVEPQPWFLRLLLKHGATWYNRKPWEYETKWTVDLQTRLVVRRIQSLLLLTARFPKQKKTLWKRLAGYI